MLPVSPRLAALLERNACSYALDLRILDPRSMSSFFSNPVPPWVRDYARHRQQRWRVPMSETVAEYTGASDHDRVEMHRLWHDIEKHQIARSVIDTAARLTSKHVTEVRGVALPDQTAQRRLQRREIAFELRTARAQGAEGRVRDLEALLHVLDEEGK